MLTPHAANAEADSKSRTVSRIHADNSSARANKKKTVKSGKMEVPTHRESPPESDQGAAQSARSSLPTPGLGQSLPLATKITIS